MAKVSILLYIAFAMYNLATASTLPEEALQLEANKRLEANPKLVQLGNYEGKYYFTEPQSSTWQQSKDICAANNLELINIDSEGEFNYLDLVLPVYYYWTSAINTKNYVWGNGKPVNLQVITGQATCVSFIAGNLVSYDCTLDQGFIPLCQLTV